MNLSFEVEQEDDGRWLAERLEHQECGPMKVRIVVAAE